ncbi:hypothetical protein SCACP_10590 [Sporomusa carbonis]|uniref:SIMPL domain-containing protein n=1 Tax=Sporomusa carbonis TaxID=3076075 RepID=UPI003A782259
MFKSIKIFAVVLLLTLAAIPATLAAENHSNATEVSVSGTHQEEISPDIAYINLGTVTEAETIAAAQTKNADVMTKLHRQLENLGIKPEYITTAHYTVTPLYKNDDNGRRLPSIRGYQVINNITITTSPDQTGEIIDTALANGADQVNSIRFGKRAETDVKNAALAQAVRDAMSKADAIAVALNKRVVKVKAVNENSVNLQSPEVSNRLYAKSSLSDAVPTTPISPGLVLLTAHVQVVVELE